MNGLQMNMLLARLTILEDKLNLIIKASGINAVEVPGENITEAGPDDNIADPTKAVSYTPDVKGPDDPDNKANTAEFKQDAEDGTEEDVVNDNRLSKGPLVDAVEKHYKQFPQEKDELSDADDDHPLAGKPNTDF